MTKKFRGKTWIEKHENSGSIPGAGIFFIVIFISILFYLYRFARVISGEKATASRYHIMTETIATNRANMARHDKKRDEMIKFVEFE